jgi:hypothetical protein
LSIGLVSRCWTLSAEYVWPFSKRLTDTTDFLLKAYDGIRRRCLPRIYAALEPGTEDDRMKGALWTLNSSAFGECVAVKKVFSVGIDTLFSQVCDGWQVFSAQLILKTVLNVDQNLHWPQV